MYDIYREFAAAAFDVAEQDVTPTQRREAQLGAFALQYLPTPADVHRRGKTIWPSAGTHYGTGLVEDFTGDFAKLSLVSEQLSLYELDFGAVEQRVLAYFRGTGKRTTQMLVDEVYGRESAGLDKPLLCTPGLSKRKPRPWFRKERW